MVQKKNSPALPVLTLSYLNLNVPCFSSHLVSTAFAACSLPLRPLSIPLLLLNHPSNSHLLQGVFPDALSFSPSVCNVLPVCSQSTTAILARTVLGSAPEACLHPSPDKRCESRVWLCSAPLRTSRPACTWQRLHDRMSSGRRSPASATGAFPHLGSTIH